MSDRDIPRSLVDQVVVITGAASGIGRHLAELLVGGGANVVAIDRHADALEALSPARNAENLLRCAVDVTAADAIGDALQSAVDKFGQLHVLVNNAGIVRHGSVLEMAPIEWREVLDVNLTGAFLCAQAAARHMVRERYGRIVNVSSHAASLGTPGRSAYSAAKAGMLALTRSLAIELASDGVTANAVTPGAIETPRVTHEHSGERRSAWNRAIPLGRYGTMQELADSVLFLASREAGYITGQALGVDGGYQVAGFRPA